MNWVFIGILLGSTVTSQHDTKEACLGRYEVLKEKGVVGQCIEQRHTNGVVNLHDYSNDYLMCWNNDTQTLGSCKK